jgi:hypothetical protein
MKLGPFDRASRLASAGTRHAGAKREAQGRPPVATGSALSARMAWMTEGACLTRPEINWFPTDGDPADDAKAVCRWCSVHEQCLDQAIARHEYGVWGGTTEREREKLRALLRSPSPEVSPTITSPLTGEARILPFS